MLYFHKELKEKLKSDYQIQKAVKEKKFKVDGMYSDKPNVNYIEIIAKKNLNFVIYGDFHIIIIILLTLFQIRLFLP